MDFVRQEFGRFGRAQSKYIPILILDFIVKLILESTKFKSIIIKIL